MTANGENSVAIDTPLAFLARSGGIDLPWPVWVAALALIMGTAWMNDRATRRERGGVSPMETANQRIRFCLTRPDPQALKARL
jgi:hypothetical protein